MSVLALEAAFTLEIGTAHARFRVEAEAKLEKGVLVLFGPSGTGKSLTLQALAGLIRPTSGYVRVNGETLFDADARIWVPAHRRRLGYVPQHDSLFPFRDVAENVLFGLPRAERKRDDPRILALLEELGIAHLERARPDSLSGGERQRVALARALAVRPRLMLLDEPFAAIDAGGRATIRRALRKTLAAHDTPAVFITHDPREALVLGDTLVQFERGRTTACGAPADLLGGRRTICVRGRVRGAPKTDDAGCSTWTLDGVQLSAPDHLVRSENGEVAFEFDPGTAAEEG